jgi:hypothetical protein
MRHATQFWGGEDIDEETQLPHMAAVAFHALTILTFMEEHPEFDDRYKGHTEEHLKSEEAVAFEVLLTEPSAPAHILHENLQPEPVNNQYLGAEHGLINTSYGSHSAREEGWSED